MSKCIETFVALLQSITNRYKALNDVTLQLHFVELQVCSYKQVLQNWDLCLVEKGFILPLQCELIEDLRLRFAQILREQQAFPLSEKFCLMLGSSQYLVDVLNTWTELPLFLRYEITTKTEFIWVDLTPSLQIDLWKRTFIRRQPRRQWPFHMCHQPARISGTTIKEILSFFLIQVILKVC